MNTTHTTKSRNVPASLIRFGLASSLALGLCATTSWSQDSDDGEEIYTLSPFAVSAAEETGYYATSTLAGTRLKTELGDLPNSITVATKEFMED